MRNRWLTILVLAAIVSGCKRPGSDPPIQTDAPGSEAERGKFQGSWNHLSIDLNGKQAAPHVAAGFVYRFAGDRFTITNNGKVTSEGSFTIDPSKSPPAIDLLEPNDVRIYGIYRFEADRLTLCMHEKRRPTEFESKPGQVRTLLALEQRK